MERNEAIEVVKRNYPHVTESGSQFETALRILIPELKESEDEKIRKAILEHIQLCTESIPDRDKFIAWLEKQGEQNPTDEEMQILLQTEYEKGKADAIEQKSAWSEDDEKAVNDIMWIIEAYRKNGFNETHIQIANDSENWLKSLKERYTWKPSESDILLLERIANGKSNPKDFQASLGGLIGQLKKLREE